MAKKRKADGGGPRKRRKTRPDDLLERAGLPDPRTTETLLREMLGAGAALTDDSPPGKAQALLNRAYAEPDAGKRAELARQAVQAWPDCADAFVLLAETAPTQKEALPLYEQAVAAGERALGPEVFKEHAGNFWLLLETRPYMRARQGLAFVLWAMGRREEAVPHAQELLRLNPNDNQGVRYTLAAWLLNLDRDEDLAQLLRQYDEDSATWLYTKALLAFRQEGESDEARRLLREAKKTNKHVPAYLLGEKLLPAQPPNGYVPGEPSEAIQYAGTFLAGWRNTDGAITWLRQAKKSPRKKQEEPRPVGPLPIVRQRLRKLPQRADTWQVGWTRLSDRVRTDAGPVHPWAVLVASEMTDLILGHAIALEEPTSDVLWDALAQAMERPVAGQSYRPTSLHVRQDARWEEVGPHLDELGIRLEYGDDFELIDTILQGLASGIGRPRETGLLDIPGVGPGQAGSFYEAAAFFYRQAPWKRIGYETAIKIECPKYPGGPRYAVVMGQSGMVMGVALYEDLGTLQRLWTGQMSDQENVRDTVATAVTFGDDEEVPGPDVEAAKQYGWTVARRDAYPIVYRKEVGDTMRLPEAWELELLEACLRAIPPFVQRRRADDPTREDMVVPVASGEMTLSLSWVVDI